MAELRDSALLFSLKRLVNTEQERIDNPAQQARVRAVAEIRARSQQQRLEREADRFRAIEAERRRICEETARHEETARMTAIRQSHLEQARVASQARARLAALEQQRVHERRLAEISQRTRRRWERVLLLASCSLTVITLGAALAVYFGRLEPEQRLMQKAYRELVAVEKERADYAERLAAETDRRNQALFGEVEQLRQELKGERGGQGGRHSERSGRRGVANTRTTGPLPGGKRHRKERCRDDGDPMNDCLG